MRQKAHQLRYHLLTLGLLLSAMVQVGYLALRRGYLDSLGAGLVFEAVLGLLVILTLASALQPGLLLWIGKLPQRLAQGAGRGAWLIWAGTLLILPWMVIGPMGRFFEPLLVRAVVLWLLGLFGAQLLTATWEGRAFPLSLAATLLAGGSCYLVSTYLPGISTYPLSLAWSETSRYYYASLFLSERIYGMSVPPSVLHPSRYLLQTVPFLLPDSQLVTHRLWQTFLWIGLPIAASSLLVWRLGVERRSFRGLAGLWAFLFIFQGPILYHLLISVIIVLWGFREERFWRSMLIVAAASAWAGISRINWFPVPGFLAATIYFARSPRGSNSFWRYWARPAAWIGVGSLIALGAYSGYILLSGNEAGQFGSSLTSDLLWYRLLPNRTFLPGILLAAGSVTLPLGIVLWQAYWGRETPRDIARWLPVACMLVALLIGGVIVSLKIGGGSNLHNLDAYLIVLMAVGAHAYFGRLKGQGERPELRWGTHALLVALPVLFSLNAGGPAPALDHDFADGVVEQVRSRIDKLGIEDPQVLFIAERHLLTFEILEDVRLIPEYEKVFLMEMAMGGTQPYLDGFHDALRGQRYDLIVSDPLRIQFQGRSRAFGEENDAWVREVSAPILCYYEPVVTIEGAEVQVLAPREEPVNCRGFTDDG